MVDVQAERWLYLHKARKSFDCARSTEDPDRAQLHLDLHRLYLRKVDELYPPRK